MGIGGDTVRCGNGDRGGDTAGDVSDTCNDGTGDDGVTGNVGDICMVDAIGIVCDNDIAGDIGSIGEDDVCITPR